MRQWQWSGRLSGQLVNTVWAVVFGVATWLLINASIRQVQEHVPVSVEIRRPPGLALVFRDTGTATPPEVYVSIEAPQSELQRRADAPLRAVIDLPELVREGRLALDLTAGGEVTLPMDWFEFPDKPAEVAVLGETFQPPTIALRLVPEASAELRVEPRLSAVPRGWEARVTRVEPTLVRTSGPRDVLDRTSTIPTVPIPVETQARRLPGWRPDGVGSHEIAALEVPLDAGAAGGSLTPAQRTVRVWLTLSPEPYEKPVEVQPVIVSPFGFPAVRLRLEPLTPGTVQLQLRGPENVLRAEDLLARLRMRVQAVLSAEKAAELKPDTLTRLPVYVYPPPGIEVRDAEHEAGRYRLRREFDVEVKALAPPP